MPTKPKTKKAQQTQTTNTEIKVTETKTEIKATPMAAAPEKTAVAKKVELEGHYVYCAASASCIKRGLAVRLGSIIVQHPLYEYVVSVPYILPFVVDITGFGEIREVSLPRLLGDNLNGVVALRNGDKFVYSFAIPIRLEPVLARRTMRGIVYSTYQVSASGTLRLGRIKSVDMLSLYVSRLLIHRIFGSEVADALKRLAEHLLVVV